MVTSVVVVFLSSRLGAPHQSQVRARRVTEGEAAAAQTANCEIGDRCSGATRQGRRQILDFDRSQPYILPMTKLLDEAFETVRRLPSHDQDDIARAIIQLAGSDLAAPIALSPEEREAIA